MGNRDEMGRKPCANAGETRDAFGRCTENREPRPVEPTKSERRPGTTDILPIPRTVKTDHWTEKYRHDAIRMAEAAALNREFGNAPTAYRSQSRGDSFMFSSDQLGVEYVSIESFPDVNYQGPLNQAGISSPPPPPPYVNPCVAYEAKYPSPTMSATHTTLLIGSCVIVTVSSGPGYSIELVHDYIEEGFSIFRMRELDPDGTPGDHWEICIDAKADNFNCAHPVELVLTDACKRTFILPLAVTKPSLHAAYYVINKNALNSGEIPFAQEGCHSISVEGWCGSVCWMTTMLCDGTIPDNGSNYFLWTCGGWHQPCQLYDRTAWTEIMKGELQRAPGQCPPVDIRTPEQIMDGCCPDPMDY